METADADSSTNRPAVIAPYPQESLLLDVVAEAAGDRILCTSPGLAQFAGAAASAHPHANVSCTYLDLYRAELALAHWHQRPANLHVECAADLPAGEADVVALPFSVSGEAELVWDLLQSGHERLRIGGQLFASTDNPHDTWLALQLQKIFRTVERRARDGGVLYVATKTEALRKLKDYSCEFAFRDRGRLVRAVSRPGVFSHRHIDPGARHLIDAMEIQPGMRVLDIGCGAGTVALAASCRADGVAVHAIDSNARAVECTARGAVLNGFANVTVELNADGNIRDTGAFDLALANPPYYAGFRIAEHFLNVAHSALAPGGSVLVVTKHPAWYAEHMPRWFAEVTAVERKGYVVFGGVVRR